jgi:hypothetical protein
LNFSTVIFRVQNSYHLNQFIIGKNYYLSNNLIVRLTHYIRKT